MKTPKFLIRNNFILLSAAILMAFTSCKKDDVADETPLTMLAFGLRKKLTLRKMADLHLKMSSIFQKTVLLKLPRSKMIIQIHGLIW